VPVTREQIRRMAALAELAVDDRAAAALETQLGRILDFVRQLESLDAGPAGEADPRAVALRPDVVGPDPLHRPPGEFAPAFQDGLFLVPRIGETGGGTGEA
jgi:aspartyl-tRNA(Asn)/glutamyl-tRNA(Gln) amidotransferase subunit C